MTSHFTVVFFNYGQYSGNRKIKSKLERMRSESKLRWNKSKIVELASEDLSGVLTAFGYKDLMRNDSNLMGRSGSTGIWENESGNDAVKIIMFNKKHEDEHLPIVMVYKGVEGGEDSFYGKFIRYCFGIGATLSAVLEKDGKFEEIHKKKTASPTQIIEFQRLQYELDTEEGSKQLLKRSFTNKIDELKKMGYNFSSEFTIGWQKLIDKYGVYTDKKLYKEIETINKINQSDETVVETDIKADDIVKLDDNMIKEVTKTEIKKENIGIEKKKVTREPFVRKKFLIKFPETAC